MWRNIPRANRVYTVQMRTEICWVETSELCLYRNQPGRRLQTGSAITRLQTFCLPQLLGDITQTNSEQVRDYGRQTDPKIHKSGTIHVGNPQRFDQLPGPWEQFMALNYAAYCINFWGNYSGRYMCLLTSSVSEAAVEDTFMTPPPPLTPLSNGVMPMPAPPPLRTSPASKKRLSKISPAEMLEEEAWKGHGKYIGKTLSQDLIGRTRNAI